MRGMTLMELMIVIIMSASWPGSAVPSYGSTSSGRNAWTPRRHCYESRQRRRSTTCRTIAMRRLPCCRPTSRAVSASTARPRASTPSPSPPDGSDGRLRGDRHAGVLGTAGKVTTHCATFTINQSGAETATNTPLRTIRISAGARNLARLRNLSQHADGCDISFIHPPQSCILRARLVPGSFYK